MCYTLVMMTSSADGPLPVIVIGAGAAGLMAAIFAARGPRPVLLLEGTRRPGQKILISGGGRCNVLPSQASAADFISDGSPHTLRKILSAWPLAEVRRFFEEELGVPLRLEHATGKLFPAANRARVVLDALLAAFLQRGGTLRTGARVVGLTPASPAADRGSTTPRQAPRQAPWQVHLETGETLVAGSVILATGGLSAPKTGSDGTGLRIAQELGHTLVPTYPALVPLTSECAAHHALAGLSLPVTLTALWPGSKRRFQTRGGFLFTHRGYSGPAVLNLSHVATRSLLTPGPRATIWVQWTERSADAWDARLRAQAGPLLPLLREALPERLAHQLLIEAGLADVKGAQLRREDRARLVQLLTRYELPWIGHEGYRTAEVTGGGVPLHEVDPVTLESRRAPGVYLCGEMLDACGPIGGYNFLWAWVTGRLAGIACARA